MSTVVFNGNPLLRFDGYYILMDLLEIPNLRQKSTEITRRFFVWLCLGIEQPENPFLPHDNQWAFAAYTIAAVIYRWVVVFSIVFFLNKVFEPYGLKIIGQIMALSGFVGPGGAAAVGAGQVFLDAGEDEQNEKASAWPRPSASSRPRCCLCFSCRCRSR